jgi:hypothetical protein
MFPSPVLEFCDTDSGSDRIGKITTVAKEAGKGCSNQSGRARVVC